MKKFITLLLTILFLMPEAIAISSEVTTGTSPISSKEAKLYTFKLKTKRLIIANALRLNEKQKEQAYTIYTKTEEKEGLLIAQIQRERKLLATIDKKADKSAYNSQKKVVLNLEDAFDEMESESTKEFTKILDHEQRVKFRRLKNEITLDKLL